MGQGTAVSTHDGKRSRNLDALRGLAALLVLMFHAGGVLPRHGSDGLVRLNPLWLFSVHGGAGVYLFFALSGYLVGGPWLRGGVAGSLPGVRVYAIRRAARILPLYWLTVVGALVVVMTGLPRSAVQPDGTAGVVAHVAMVQNWVPGQALALYGPLWTLGLEASFYVLLPLMAAAVVRLSPSGAVTRRALIAFLAATTILSQALCMAVPGFVSTFAGAWGWFGAGMLVAAWSDSAWWRPRWTVSLLLGCVLWIVAVGTTQTTSSYPAPSVFYGLGSTFLVLSAVEAPRAWPGTAALASVGIASYSLYLLHGLVMPLLPRVPAGDAAPAVAFAVAAAVCLPLAFASYWLVERPCLRWARGVTSARRTVPSLENAPVPPGTAEALARSQA